VKKEGFGLLLAVAKGSVVDPHLIVIEYRGNPKSKENVMVVGKGVTYDTGGLNLKPDSSMMDMKCDMSGAAACLGLIIALKNLKSKKNVTVIIPTTENAISGASYKQGDVHRSFLGKTVEIDNTDAEGRLILADALAWGNKEYKPSCIIDLATLTGGVVVAFAEELTGLMGNDEGLIKKLREASERTFERTWQLPLYEEFKDLLASPIADMRNCGEKGASSIKGGMFLKEFVGTTPWAHLDIAGTAFLDREKRYWPKGATGVGIRLLVDFLEHD
jgi:leucyl aminopeptidase